MGTRRTPAEQSSLLFSDEEPHPPDGAPQPLADVSAHPAPAERIGRPAPVRPTATKRTARRSTAKGAVLPQVHPPWVHALAEGLPPALRMGTCSWSFEGWRGLVYDVDAPATRLAKDGLAAYAQHPLFRTVEVDRTWYAPVGADLFRQYASQVPPAFRFAVKAHQDITTPPGRAGGRHAPAYLDADAAMRDCLAPAIEGLGDQLGPMIFQFPPLSPGRVGGTAQLAADLHRFGTELRTRVGPAQLLVVEFRHPALFVPEVDAALRDCGIVRCCNGHPDAPPLAQQLEHDADAVPAGPLVIRWMLHRGYSYVLARDSFSPFTRLVAPDEVARRAILVAVTRAARQGREAWVLVNNKAEGSSPLSIEALAVEWIDAVPTPTPGGAIPDLHRPM